MNCADCIYYRKGVCYNITSPIMGEEVDERDTCEEWEGDEHE